MSSLALLAVFEFLGRVFVAQLFVIGGFRKVTDPARVKQQITDAGIPMPAVAYPISVAADVIGSVGLLLGWHVSEVAAMLALFTTAIAFTVHRNWSDRATLNLFMMDFTIIGGLLAIAVHGAGPLSLDAWLG